MAGVIGECLGITMYSMVPDSISATCVWRSLRENIAWSLYPIRRLNGTGPLFSILVRHCWLQRRAGLKRRVGLYPPRRRRIGKPVYRTLGFSALPRFAGEGWRLDRAYARVRLGT